MLTDGGRALPSAAAATARWLVALPDAIIHTNLLKALVVVSLAVQVGGLAALWLGTHLAPPPPQPFAMPFTPAAPPPWGAFAATGGAAPPPAGVQAMGSLPYHRGNDLRRRRA